MNSAGRLVAAWACTALVGCGAPEMQSGIRIGDKTLDQFKEGKTKETWLLAILGEPTSSSTVSDEPEVRILRYSTMQSETPGFVGSLLGQQSERNVATIYFVIRNGVVEKMWADRDDQGGLFNRSGKSGEKQD